MTMETIFTAIIPAILIFFLVFFNIRKMQKQAKIMKMEQEGKCGTGCAGCAHSKGCHSDKKTID
ncbi:MAG: FeoB-associated Cys-rich membrane protein [Bacillota bacterium]|nr:FeoB-associated Cys-rich membrane protein [Bacillota bacterium]